MFFRNHKYVTGFVLASFVFGAAAYAGGSTNTPETGYTLCFNTKTRVVTLPGDETCGKGTQKFEVAGKNQFNIASNSGSTSSSNDESFDPIFKYLHFTILMLFFVLPAISIRNFV